MDLPLVAGAPVLILCCGCRVASHLRVCGRLHSFPQAPLFWGSGEDVRKLAKTREPTQYQLLNTPVLRTILNKAADKRAEFCPYIGHAIPMQDSCNKPTIRAPDMEVGPLKSFVLN